MSEKIPLSECLLMGFFQPFSFWEVPTGELAQAFPERTVVPLEERGPVRFLPEAPRPLFSLQYEESGDRDRILVGSNPVGYSARDEAYQGWDEFLQTGLEVLQKASNCFRSGERLQPLVLFYSDIFELAPDDEPDHILTAYRHASEVNGGMRLAAQTVGTMGLLAGTTTSIRRESSIRFSAGEDDQGRNLVVNFEVGAALPLPKGEENTQIVSRWLERAHRVQKKMLWDVLDHSLRSGATKLFDQEEARAFSSEPPGIDTFFDREEDNE